MKFGVLQFFSWPERRIPIGTGALAFGDLALQVPGDRLSRLREEPLLEIYQEDVEPRGRRHVRDAAAHLPAADDADSLDVHGRRLYCRPARESNGRQEAATENRGVPKRESMATPTATTEAALHTKAPT